MTRVLSDLLGAEQPRFGMTILQLERATGRPSTDVRLTVEILQRVQQKLHALHLDQRDTTGKELYYTLIERFHNDEALVKEVLRLTEAASAQAVLAGIIKFLEANLDSQPVFALKNSVAKRFLKAVPPKRAMKQLGYRSLDSMLKHEITAHVYLIAFFYESLSWRKKFLEQYTKLQPSDFELRKPEISLPKAAKWNAIITQFTKKQFPITVFKELGAVVVLPSNKNSNVIATTILIIEGLNEIQSANSFLKLQQMKPDFGTYVKTIADNEPVTQAELVGRVVPWRAVHQYYARFKESYNPLIFEPHIQATDLTWLHPESLLAKIHPVLDFWRDTSYTAHTHNSEQVSLNVFDVAQNYMRQAPYEHRTTQALRRTLWQELMIRYLDHANVEQAIAGDLQAEPVFVDSDN